MKTISIATFNELEPAQALVEQFEQVGIHAFIRNESKLERLWFMSEPLAAIHVDVPQPDYLKARQLLAVFEVGNEHNDMVHCPECGSSRVEFPQITRKFFMPATLAFFMWLHLIPREYYCEDCQFTWPKEKLIEPDRDVLNFPLNSEIGMKPLHPIRHVREWLKRKRRVA